MNVERRDEIDCGKFCSSEVAALLQAKVLVIRKDENSAHPKVINALRYM